MIRTLSNFSRIRGEHDCMEHTTDVPRLESSLMWLTVSRSSRGRSSIRSTEGTVRAASSQARRSFLRRCLARSLTGMSSILKTETWWVTREEASVRSSNYYIIGTRSITGCNAVQLDIATSLIGVCNNLNTRTSREEQGSNSTSPVFETFHNKTGIGTLLVDEDGKYE